MSEERKMILQMLQEGKISEDEALRLLDAVEEPKSTSDELEESASKLASKLMNGINSALRKTGDALSGIDVGEWTVDFGSNRKKTERILKTKLEEAKPSISIENLNGRIHLYSWDNDYIEARATINYDSKEIPLDYDFITSEKIEGTYQIKANYSSTHNRFSADLSIALPRLVYQELNLKNLNGSVEVNFIEANNINCESTNGKIQFNSVKAENISLETTQGSIEALDIHATRLSANSTNGNISVRDLSTQNLITQTINGVTRIADLNEEVRSIETSTVNGNVYISIDDYNKPIRAHLKAKRLNDTIDLLGKFSSVEREGKATIAKTEAYDESNENNLEIDSNTVNGRITIS